MQSDPQPAPDSSASEPAQDAPSLDSFAEAFRSAPDALKDRTPSGQPADAPPPEVSAPAGASKPGEPGASPPSRRGAAAKISEQQSEIDRLVAERQAEKARLDEVEARVRAQDEARESARKSAIAKIGDDQEFAQLSTKRMRGEVLSYEDDERLSSMLAWREHAADLWEMTDRAHKAQLARAAADRVDRYGLDKGVAYDAPLPELIDHVVSVTEARVKAEQANQIKELQTELRGLRTRGAARSSPTLGGLSDGSDGRFPDDDASPADWFRAGFAEQARAERSAAPSGANGTDRRR